MEPLYDAIVVGGGAAGLTAAVCLAREAGRRRKTAAILLVEKGPRVGKSCWPPATAPATSPTCGRRRAGTMGRTRPLSGRRWPPVPPPTLWRFSPPSGWNARRGRTEKSIHCPPRRRRCWTACGWRRRRWAWRSAAARRCGIFGRRAGTSFSPCRTGRYGPAGCWSAAAARLPPPSAAPLTATAC